MPSRWFVWLAGLGVATSGCAAFTGVGDLEEVACLEDCDGAPGDAPSDSGGSDAVNADAAVRADAFADSTLDAPDVGCDGALCAGQCVASCNGCSAGNVLCTATRTCGNCTSCPGAVIQCFTCSDGGNPAGTCEPFPNAYCLNTIYATCPCGTTSACPGATQVCKGGNEGCLTCGDQTRITGGHPCKGGGVCQENNSPPVCL